MARSQTNLGDAVSREDLFYAVYALLHAPAYRAKFAENLKRELPRLPLDFFVETVAPDAAATRLEEGGSPAKSSSARGAGLPPSSNRVAGDSKVSQWAELVEIGRALGDLHVGYENAQPAKLTLRDTTRAGDKYSFRALKMRWNKDKSQLFVHDSIEMTGSTRAMFDPRLGNRSALDWVVVCSRQERCSL